MILTSKEIIEQILDQSKEIDSDIIRDIVDTTALDRLELEASYKRYKGEVPILNRGCENENRPCNKLPSDYRGEVTDQKVGYSFGNAITVGYTDESDKVQDQIHSFNKLNSTKNLDRMTATYAAACGVGNRLLYVGTDGLVHVMNANPWECILVNDMSINEPQYGFRIYPIIKKQGSITQERMRVEWYDRLNVTYFEQNSQGAYVEIEKKRHMFEGIPLLEFPNNDLKFSDFHKAEDYIDAYDWVMSFNQDEIEAFRHAIPVFENTMISQDTIDRIRS